MIQVHIPDGLLGRTVDLGTVHVTRAMIEEYARAVGDSETLAGALDEAPPTFCLTMRRGMTPEVALPHGTFGVYGGHDIELHQPIRAGVSYGVTGCIADVYEKSGRGGSMTVIVRQAEIRDTAGRLAVRMIEREIVRQVPA
jgi:hypothetical protein